MVRPSASAARRHAATREMRSTRKARRSRPRHSRETRLASISAALSQLACLGVVDFEAAPEAATFESAEHGYGRLQGMSIEVVLNEMNALRLRAASSDLLQR